MSAHVVILGGGVGGSTVAMELRNLLGAEHRITLVERSGRFVLGASLLRVIVGERSPEEISRPVAALAQRGIRAHPGGHRAPGGCTSRTATRRRTTCWRSSPRTGRRASCVRPG